MAQTKGNISNPNSLRNIIWRQNIDATIFINNQNFVTQARDMPYGIELQLYLFSFIKYAQYMVYRLELDKVLRNES